MVDDNLRRGGPNGPPKAHSCGACHPNPPRFLCPTCPRRDSGHRSDDDHGWGRLRTRDPEAYAVLYPCAKAARLLAITPEGGRMYASYLADYRKACQLRDEYWAAKRAGQSFQVPRPTEQFAMAVGEFAE